MKAAHARVAAGKAHLTALAAKGYADPIWALKTFNYRKAFAFALRAAWAQAKDEAERIANPGLHAVWARHAEDCRTDGRRAA